MSDRGIRIYEYIMCTIIAIPGFACRVEIANSLGWLLYHFIVWLFSGSFWHFLGFLIAGIIVFGLTLFIKAVISGGPSCDDEVYSSFSYDAYDGYDDGY